MKRILKILLPKAAYDAAKQCFYALVKAKYRTLGRPARQGESAKARARRLREGFFDKYCTGRGLDIGYGGDLLETNCTGWDFEHGDAQYLRGLPDASFDFVYASHTLEHMVDPGVTLANWWRVLKPGGHLIIFIPERDLYEKKKTLPSRWNLDHKHFFLLDRDEAPDTIGIVPLIRRLLPGQMIVRAEICREGHTIDAPDAHSDGEYSIEVVVKKMPAP